MMKDMILCWGDFRLLRAVYGMGSVVIVSMYSYMCGGKSNL